MSSNRKIDAMVAEKIYGWRWVRVPGGKMELAHPDDATGFMGDDSINLRHPPRFSTDPSAAWSVVDKMGRDGYLFDIDNFTGTDAEPWNVRCNKRGTDWDDTAVVGEASTPMLAACLCCLRAVGCPESEIETAMSERRGG